jgi:isocitrate/isopropylmalate dehydrogenase
MLLSHLGHAAPATLIDDALHAALSDHVSRTPDLGGSATTTQMAQAIVNHIEGAAP